MAISKAHFDMLLTLSNEGHLPRGVDLLEIGEANWYGDHDPEEVFCGAGERCDPQDGYAMARLIYKAIFDPKLRHAIDAGGPTAEWLDLNKPIKLKQQYDVVYNHGTAEHVFNIAQVFRTMHEACKDGGLMIHECPFTGWVDHGFYCLQPTLFWDLAKANDYRIKFAAVEHLASRTFEPIPCRDAVLETRRRGQLADNLMLYVVLRKTVDAEFRIPMQGVYAGQVSEAAEQAWRELR